MRTESTLLIWPAPIPIVAPPAAITIALERTCRQTLQANSRSCHCASVGALAVFTRICSLVSETTSRV